MFVYLDRGVVYQYLSKSLFCSFVRHREKFVRKNRKREQSSLIAYITNATVFSLNEFSKHHHRSASVPTAAANNQTKLTKTMKDKTVFFFVSVLANTLYTIIYLYQCSFVFVGLFAFALSLSFARARPARLVSIFCPFIHSKTTKRNCHTNSFIRKSAKTFCFNSCYRTWNSKCSMIHTNWTYKLLISIEYLISILW